MGMFFDPYSDYGFKKLFGEESSKDILTDFLNTMLPEEHQIVDWRFADEELVPSYISDRIKSFDIFCTAANDDRFIVEVQKAQSKNFKDVALLYSSLSLRSLMKHDDSLGKKRRFSALYFVGISNSLFDEVIGNNGLPVPNKLYISARYCDDDNVVFYSGLTIKFVQMPLFQKTEKELESRFDKWLYFLKNLQSFERIPQILNDPVFAHAFEVAKLSNMNQEERETYNKDIAKRDEDEG
ncbi:MAG: Rpn family recombination-promoting nuclease/putative transposase [Planctomycetaceae bacterium]|jgi:predicted transposase/invertase (TIGR01784 family)|nr:Rpn family recombination-promoting nuclease/putative transposase [Planctomycetaceae bacterium]